MFDINIPRRSDWSQTRRPIIRTIEAAYRSLIPKPDRFDHSRLARNYGFRQRSLQKDIPPKEAQLVCKIVIFFNLLRQTRSCLTVWLLFSKRVVMPSPFFATYTKRAKNCCSDVATLLNDHDSGSVVGEQFPSHTRTNESDDAQYRIGAFRLTAPGPMDVGVVAERVFLPD